MRHLVMALVCASLCGCIAAPRPADVAKSAATVMADPARQLVVTVRNAPVRTAQHAGSTPKAYDGTGRYQVSPAALRDAAALARRYSLREVAAWPIELLDVHCIVFQVDNSRPLAAVLTELTRDPRVESAQPLRTFGALSNGYDDPYLGLQGSVAAMQVEEAHRWSRGHGVRVAVIDSGIDVTHPDLAGRIVMTRDFTGGSAGDSRLDTHGTAVAGVIAALAGNGQGIVGVAPEARLLALRACWQMPADAGHAVASRCNTFTLAQAIALAIAERAQIINLSLTGPEDPLLSRLLRRAMAVGTIVICAVPEAGAPGESFPASLPGVLAVASVEAPSGAPVIAGELHAPGRDVLTLRPQGRYDFENGSSMAAANVSGVAALLLAARPQISAADVRELLQRSAGHIEKATTAAASTINACSALSALMLRGDCAAVKRMHAVRQERSCDSADRSVESRRRSSLLHAAAETAPACTPTPR